ncbi:MAG: MFS transporter [bacterium]|nr:MFS transporter [bacterium]
MVLNVILLGVVSFLNDVSGDMILPILPMFITSLGGSSLVIGLIGGLRDCVGSMLKVLAGFWSDKLGRRKIFVDYGYFTSSSFRLLLPFSTIWQHVLIFSSADRVGKGIREAPRDAIISESMPMERGRGFGIHRAFDSSGAVVGSLLAFVLFWVASFGFKLIILTAAGVGFVSLVPLYFVKEIKKEPKTSTLKVSLKELPKKVRLFIAIASIFALANFSYMFFILRAKAFFQSRLGIGIPILLYVLFSFFYALCALPFGKLADKIGKKWVIMAGYFLFGTTCLGFAFFHSLISFIIFFILYGSAYACIEGNQRAFIADLAPADLKATALGTFHTSIGLIALPSSLIAGGLWRINPALTFGFSSLASFIAVLLLLAFREKAETTGLVKAQPNNLYPVK